jgi:hypothetical protein
MTACPTTRDSPMQYREDGLLGETQGLIQMGTAFAHATRNKRVRTHTTFRRAQYCNQAHSCAAFSLSLSLSLSLLRVPTRSCTLRVITDNCR